MTLWKFCDKGIPGEGKKEISYMGARNSKKTSQNCFK